MTTFLRLPDVQARTAMSRSSIYAAMDRGEFPKPVKLLGARANAWPEHEVAEWIASRMEARVA